MDKIINALITNQNGISSGIIMIFGTICVFVFVRKAIKNFQ